MGNQLPESFMRSEKIFLESLKTPSCEVCSVLYRGYERFHGDSEVSDKPFEFLYSYNRFRLQQTRDRPEFEGLPELDYYCTAGKYHISNTAFYDLLKIPFR